MESRMVKFYSKESNMVAIHAIPGHFATSHSHINYGSSEDVVGYTLNFTHCLFVLFWFLYVIYLTGWFVKTVVKQGDQWNLNYIAYYGTILIMAAVLIQGVYTLGSLTSARIILCQYYGYAQNYMSAMLESEQILLQSEGQEVVLPASEMPVPSTGAICSHLVIVCSFFIHIL